MNIAPPKKPSMWSTLRHSIKPKKPIYHTEVIKLEDLKKEIKLDRGLGTEERTSLLQELADPYFISELKSGAKGAALFYLISKFMKLKPETKILLSIAGFGIGKLIYDYQHNPNRFTSYNEQLKLYEIK